MNNTKNIAAIIILLLIICYGNIVFANISYGNDALNIDILSAKTLSGTAGDFVTITGRITNNAKKSINDITTYLSLVDTENKLPVDLEDWSAERGLYIGTIDKGQTFPLSWKIHFVKAGTYTLSVIANIAGEDRPITSRLTQFKVKPKINLNPGQVLPVALGMPILLLALMAFIQYRRNLKVTA